MKIKFNQNLYQDFLKLRKELKETFPKCFFDPGTEKPLKIGIFHDLMARLGGLPQAPSKRLVKLFMGVYTNSIFYRIALIIPNAMRVDLDGNEVGIVSPEERFNAKIIFKTIIWDLDEGELEQYKKEKAVRLSRLLQKAEKSKEIIKPNHNVKNEAKCKQPKNTKTAAFSSKPIVTKNNPIIIIKKKRNFNIPNQTLL